MDFEQLSIKTNSCNSLLIWFFNWKKKSWKFSPCERSPTTVCVGLAFSSVLCCPTIQFARNTFRRGSNLDGIWQTSLTSRATDNGIYIPVLSSWISCSRLDIHRQDRSECRRCCCTRLPTVQEIVGTNPLMLRNDFSTNVRRRRNDSATDADDSSRPCRVNQRLQHYNLLLPRRAVKRKKKIISSEERSVFMKRSKIAYFS